MLIFCGSVLNHCGTYTFNRIDMLVIVGGNNFEAV